MLLYVQHHCKLNYFYPFNEVIKNSNYINNRTQPPFFTKYILYMVYIQYLNTYNITYNIIY